jgi:hypothetical protein
VNGKNSFITALVRKKPRAKVKAVMSSAQGFRSLEKKKMIILIKVIIIDIMRKLLANWIKAMK